MGVVPVRLHEPRSYAANPARWLDEPLPATAPAYARRTQLLASNILTALELQGVSQRQVALKAGVDPGTLSRLLAGKSVPDLATITLVESALDCVLCPAYQPTNGG